MHYNVENVVERVDNASYLNVFQWIFTFGTVETQTCLVEGEGRSRLSDYVIKYDIQLPR